MSRTTKELRITLESDLCAGSGFSYAGIIDTDVSYDPNGIPFISGRRLKGCLRESARMLPVVTEETERSLFGAADDEDAKGIYVGNAFPRDYDPVFWTRVRQDEKYREYLTEGSTLALFTSVRGQTMLDEKGIAKENTLRFTRVINQYMPGENEKQQFCTRITYEDSLEEALQMVVKATRNLGMNRNRGMGSVRMELEPIPETGNPVTVTDLSHEKAERVRIRYALRNLQPLILSSLQNSRSEDGISGTIMLGVLAGIYLRKEGHSAEDEFFREVFLKEGAAFSHLTLAVPEEKTDGYRPMFPAPMYINSLKKTKKIVNMAAADESEGRKESSGEYYYFNGNQPKKLHSHYMLWEENSILADETVKKEIIYHHSRNGRNKQDTEGQLYYMEVLSANQVFAGSICVKHKYAEELVQLLKQSRICVGKSRSAQYGSCELAGEIRIEDAGDTECRIPKGAEVLVTLLSDLILLDEEGKQTNHASDLQEQMQKEMNRCGIRLAAEEGKTAYLQTKTITGYQAVWNRRKNDLLAVEAGSAFIFRTEEELSSYPEYIGEKTQEGFGHIRISELGNMRYRMNPLKESSAPETPDISGNPLMHRVYCENLLRRISAEIRKASYRDMVERKNTFGLSSSAIGRITLMLREAMSETDNAYDCMLRFKCRLDSSKSDEVKKVPEVLPLLRDCWDVENIMEREAHIRSSFAKIRSYLEKHDDRGGEIPKLLQELPEREAEERVYRLLPECLLETLTLLKYQNKE